VRSTDRKSGGGKSPTDFGVSTALRPPPSGWANGAVGRIGEWRKALPNASRASRAGPLNLAASGAPLT